MLRTAGRLGIVSVQPHDDAENVPVETVITVTFDRDVDPFSIADGAFVLLDGETEVASEVQLVDGSIAVLDPASALEVATTYTIRLADTVRTPEGVNLTGGYGASFTTAADGAVPGGGGTGSGVVDGGEDPTGGNPQATPLTGAPTIDGRMITMRFAEEMDSAFLKSQAFKVAGGIFGEIVDGGFDGEEHVLVLQLPRELEPGEYTLILTTYLRDLDGDSYAQDVRWPIVVETATARIWGRPTVAGLHDLPVHAHGEGPLLTSGPSFVS